MIPLFDAAAMYAQDRAEIDAAIQRVLASGRLILGPEVEAFEAEFAAYTGRRHAVGVASGTDALALALRALGIGADDEVVTVANAGLPVAAAIRMAGAEPRFVDVSPQSLLIDPEAVVAALGPRVRCIVPVHLYGQVAGVEALARIAARAGIALVEDCAQAHGAAVAGRLGTIACYSFYPTKNLGAFGDAGACVTDDPSLAERLRRLRVYGAGADGVAVGAGVNSRLDELQAAVLRVLLRRLDERVARRRALVRRYDARIEPGAVEPLARDYSTDACHLYVVRCRDRRRTMARLAAAGIGHKSHYPHLVSAMPAFASPEPLPRSAAACAEVLSLPLFPSLTDADVDVVAECVSAPS